MCSLMLMCYVPITCEAPSLDKASAAPFFSLIAQRIGEPGTGGLTQLIQSGTLHLWCTLVNKLVQQMIPCPTKIKRSFIPLVHNRTREKVQGNSCSISSSGKSIYLLDVFIQQIPLLNVASYFNVTRPSPYKLWNNSTLKLEPEMIGTKWQSLLVWNPKSEDKSRPQTEGSNSPPY